MRKKQQRIVCEKCNHSFTVSNFKRHEASCDGFYKEKVDFKYTGNCRFCGKELKDSNSQSNHELRCSNNPEKISTKKIGSSGGNQYTLAKKLGLEKPKVSEATSKKISDSIRNRSDDLKLRIASSISKTIKKKVVSGDWHTSLAKKMHYEYNGVDLHGRWELAYAIFLDEKCIRWSRPKQSFDYSFLDKDRKYTPDFYLIDEDCYVEIKGYETEKDRAKWSQFKLNLKILKAKEISAYIDFVEKKYGENFYDSYRKLV